MENVTLGMDTSTAADPRANPDCKLAYLRRRAWAKSRDSIWQEQEPNNNGGPQGPQKNPSDGEAERSSEETGRVPNKITSWLIECRTPLGASLDDQSASPNKGAQRNGCSFEDDLSLGAEANHLQSSSSTTQPCFGLAADQKRSRFKEDGGRSMNSTGSGKSSTVSSVSELLDLYEEDPEEILLNLGFGREEPDLPSRVPSRFINNGSSARGIDIKVYLGAQMQRMELENPNYALTSRFRQIEVLTTVANEFFQLYSQVSGQPVQRISKDQGGEGAEEKAKERSPLKKSNSALNVAKRLKKTLSKHNLIAAAAAEAPEAHEPKQQTQLTRNPSSDHTNTNGDSLDSPEQGSGCSDPDQKAETVNLKPNRKKDSCSLATVTEETNGDAEESPKQKNTEPTANGEPQPESADSASTIEAENEGTPVVSEEEKEEEKILTSTPEKASPFLVPPQLAQLRTENANSFDMEEIQSNEDEAVPHRTSKATDLLRTVSQQSDSSGFAEEPSVDPNTNLKVQESVDSCDSETTVTSHPSQDVATPIALDHIVFELPDGTEEEMKPREAAAQEKEKRKSQEEEEEHDGKSGQIAQYTPHNFLKSTPMGMQQDETPEEEQTDPEGEITRSVSTSEHQPESEMTKSSASEPQPLHPQPDLQHFQDQSASDQNPQSTQTQTETSLGTEPPAEGVAAEGGAQEKQELVDTPSSSVISALRRAKLSKMGKTGQSYDVPQISPSGRGSGRGRGRGRGGLRLQRSSSLPSSFLSPSRVVSSVNIQFGKGQVSCTQPTYSFKYTQEPGEEEEEEEEVEEEEQTNCVSTLIINPAPSSCTRTQPKPPTEAPVTPKPDPPGPIPQYLMQSSRSLRSSSPLPEWLQESYAHSWSTQSVPDLTSSSSKVNHFPQNIVHQNQQSWNPGQNMSAYPNPAVQHLNPSPNPSPSLNAGSYPFAMYPPLQYPSPLHPYSSPPNHLRCHNPSLIHHSSLTSLYRPTTPTIPPHASISSLHHPLTSTNPHHSSMGNLRPGTPLMHHQSYNHLYNYPYNHPSPYHAGPHGMQLASTYLDFNGYNMNPNMGFPHPANQFPPMSSEHGFHPGLHPSAPGFLQSLDSSFSSGQSFQHGHSPPVLSSTEMQLRRVLHDIRGTVQSLGQNQADTPDMFVEQAALASPQSLSEFQMKRQSLNLFRSQMSELELSITRQQAMVYKHLSPSDRLEVEHLQSLRSAVREELQELEQQLEDRLEDLTHQTRYSGLRRGISMDSISTSSALRAMEPVSDLLREQLFLQSEIAYDDRPLSTKASTRSSSPAGEGGGQEQKQSMYRASINIIPAPPRRPNTGDEGEEGEKDNVGAGTAENTAVEGAAGGVRTENLQDLIRQIRESVAQEVRREIYSELLATASPRKTPLPSGQQTL